MARKKSGGIGETLRVMLFAVLIAVGVRSFAFEPFNIPSESMLPTLLVGDYLFVSKYTYGYSRHSLPLSLPLISGRIFLKSPKRGDVAVFKYPKDNRTDYIKRVIGLPGDKIQVLNSVLYLNGKAVKRERVADFVTHDSGVPERRYMQYRETLPNGKQYMTLDIYPNGPADRTPVYTVPEHHYFVMGDNRDNSLDSRMAHGVGFVPEQNLVGRAEILFFSTDGSARFWEFWKWLQAARFNRFFDSIE